MLVKKDGESVSNFNDGMYNNKKPIIQSLLFFLLLVVAVSIAVNYADFVNNIKVFYETNPIYFTPDNIANINSTIIIFSVMTAIMILMISKSLKDKEDVTYIVIVLLLFFNPITIGALSQSLQLYPSFSTITMLFVPVILMFFSLNIRNIGLKR
jgi:hypothetical protein